MFEGCGPTTNQSMSTWSYIRVALILFVGASSFFGALEAAADPPIGWAGLLAILVFCPIAVVLVLGFQVINPWSAKVWRRPSWHLNPFNFREPLQFVHLAAYVCLTQGLVTLARVAGSSAPFFVEALVPLAMAGGFFAALHVGMLLFSSKVEVRT